MTLYFCRDDDGWHKVMSVKPEKNEHGTWHPFNKGADTILDTRKERKSLMPFWRDCFPDVGPGVAMEVDMIIKPGVFVV